MVGGYLRDLLTEDEKLKILEIERGAKSTNPGVGNKRKLECIELSDEDEETVGPWSGNEAEEMDGEVDDETIIEKVLGRE